MGQNLRKKGYCQTKISQLYHDNMHTISWTRWEQNQSPGKLSWKSGRASVTVVVGSSPIQGPLFPMDNTKLIYVGTSFNMFNMHLCTGYIKHVQNVEQTVN